MANIRGFDAPEGLGLRPTEAGTDAALQAARRIGTFYNQAGDALAATGQRAASTIRDVGDVAVKFEDHREISAGAKTGTDLIAQANTNWNNIAKNSDPNDPSTAQKFMTEQLEPALEKWKSGFNTEDSQRWAEQFADQYRKHMFEKTSADMSTLAGIAVQQNARSTVNSLSSAVASDPSSLDFALKTVDHTLGGMANSSPNLDAETSAKVKAAVTQEAKENIVKAAVSGMIQKNPNMDLDAIQKKYGAYIKGDEMKMFQKAAQTQAKVDALQQKQLETYQRQNNERAAESKANDTLTKNVKLDPQTGRPNINPNYFRDALEIAKMPDAPQGLARTLIDWGEKHQNERTTVVDDSATKQDLTERLFSTDNPTTRQQLMKAQVDGKLSDHSFQTMEQLVTELESSPLKGPVWQSTLAAVKDSLVVNVPGIPGKDVTGTTNYANFMQSFVPQYLAKSRAGTLPPNALDVKDPNSMISQAMAPFKRTPAQRMSDYVSGAGGLGTGAPTAEAPKVEGQTVPAPLRGIAALQYNPSKKLWRDQATGKVYDSSGVEAK